jgi:predicted transposase YbfD/YdcC
MLGVHRMMGSMLKEDLSVPFDSIEDPRIERGKKFPIEEIIFLAIFGALLGIESWRGIELIGNERIDYLRQFFPFINGIPSHQTIGRVFSILKPKSFEDFFISWAANLNGSNAGRQIAFDGKALRGSFDKAGGTKAIHILNACAVDNGITLAQLQVDAKTNEITTMPEMLNSLDIKGAMISVDALNTQKNIAEKIIDAQADYTLALKGNHKNLNEEVKFLFDTVKIDISTSADRFFSETEKSHGRITKREFEVIDVDAAILDKISDWKGLAAIGRVKTSTFRDGKDSFETRFYLLSYSSALLFGKTARGHWGIENLLHWTLDVTFSEDASRKRKDNAPRNYSLIRKFALNAIRQVKDKFSVRLAQIKASANNEYLSQMIIKSGFPQRMSSQF